MIHSELLGARTKNTRFQRRRSRPLAVEDIGKIWVILTIGDNAAGENMIKVA